MTTLLITHPACAAHDPGPGHPEARARLGAVLAALDEAAIPGVDRREAPLAGDDAIRLVHPAGHIARVAAAVPEAGYGALDPDTIVSPISDEAARRAVGAVVEAVDRVLDGSARNGFCAVRPPGHHAEPDAAMGFCLYNAVAIGARHAQASGRAERVAIVDFDVHHGNGSQRVAERDPTLFFASSHQYPFYPGTGAAHETGLGNVVNVPLARGTAGPAFRRAWERTILPALDAFAPDFLLVSAGFDAHEQDPLGGLALDESDFAWITSRLVEAADRHCGGRLVSVLEGGYDLTALGRSAVAHVAALAAD